MNISICVSLGSLLVLAPGCASSPSVLTHEEILRMPREARVAIYDGENDIVIAKSRRDAAALQTESVTRDLDELGQKWKRTEARLKKANLGDRLTWAKKTLGARRTYLQAQLKIAEAATRSADIEIVTARARLEEIRQRQLSRTGRVLAASVEPYEAKVKSLEKHVREVRQRELDVRVEAQKVFDAWKTAEEEYARATGDFDSGIWID